MLFFASIWQSLGFLFPVVFFSVFPRSQFVPFRAYHALQWCGLFGQALFRVLLPLLVSVAALRGNFLVGVSVKVRAPKYRQKMAQTLTPTRTWPSMSIPRTKTLKEGWGCNVISALYPLPSAFQGITVVGCTFAGDEKIAVYLKWRCCQGRGLAGVSLLYTQP